MHSITNHVKFDIVKCLIIASPGFVKEAFLNFLTEKRPPWLSSVKIVTGHSSSGEKYALRETLRS